MTSAGEDTLARCEAPRMTPSRDPGSPGDHRPVPRRGRRVLRPGDDERRRGDRGEGGPQVHRGDRVAAARVALRGDAVQRGNERGRDRGSAASKAGVNQRPTTCSEIGPMPVAAHRPRPGPPRAARAAGGPTCSTAERRDPVRRVRGQPHADHAAERHAVVRRVSTPKPSSSASTPRRGRRCVYGPGGAGEPPWPGARTAAAGSARPSAGELRVPQIPGGAERVAEHQDRRAGAARSSSGRRPARPRATGLAQTSKKTVSRSPCRRMSNRNRPGRRVRARRSGCPGGPGRRSRPAPGRPRWPPPRRGSRSWSRPGRAGRGRTRRRPGAAPPGRRPGWAAGPA